MVESAKKQDRKFSYADYLVWPENERWELIDGVAYDMSPAPNDFHQEVCGELYRQIANYLVGKQCKIRIAPYDVRFAKKGTPDEKIYDTTQPDISVICDSKKIETKGCIGAPDLIVEILSPSTAGKDMREKFKLYEKNGVKEYWAVHPDEKIIEVFKIKKGNYGKPEVYTFHDNIPLGIFKGDLVLDLKGIA